MRRYGVKYYHIIRINDFFFFFFFFFFFEKGSQ